MCCRRRNFAFFGFTYFLQIYIYVLRCSRRNSRIRVFGNGDIYFFARHSRIVIKLYRNLPFQLKIVMRIRIAEIIVQININGSIFAKYGNFDSVFGIVCRDLFRSQSIVRLNAPFKSVSIIEIIGFAPSRRVLFKCSSFAIGGSYKRNGNIAALCGYFNIRSHTAVFAAVRLDFEYKISPTFLTA